MGVLGVLSIIGGVFYFLYSFGYAEGITLGISIGVSLSLIITGIIFLWASTIQSLFKQLLETNTTILKILEKSTLYTSNKTKKTTMHEEKKFPIYEGLSGEIIDILEELDKRNLDIVARFGEIKLIPPIPMNSELSRKIMNHEKELIDYLEKLQNQSGKYHLSGKNDTPLYQ